MKLSGRAAASSRQSECFNRKLVHQSFEICLRILNSRSVERRRERNGWCIQRKDRPSDCKTKRCG